MANFDFRRLGLPSLAAFALLAAPALALAEDTTGEGVKSPIHNMHQPAATDAQAPVVQQAPLLPQPGATGSSAKAPVHNMSAPAQ